MDNLRLELMKSLSKQFPTIAAASTEIINLQSILNLPKGTEHFLSDMEQVWNIWRCIFRRDFLLRSGLVFLESYHCAEDLEFMVHALSLVKKPAFFHNPYYYYRAHYGNTLTRKYTLKRVEDLTAMLLCAEAHLRGRTDRCAKLLRDKLVREYVRNLSLPAEVPPAQNRAALETYKKAAGFLTMADGTELRLVCLSMRALGLANASRLILQLKQLKRQKLQKQRV